jgi:transposase-like protein
MPVTTEPNQASTELEPVRQARAKPTPAQKRAVRECYITGQGSVAFCARKHGVSEDTAYGWSDDDEWGDLRRAFDYREQERLTERTRPAEPKPGPDPIRAAMSTSQQQKLDQVEDQLTKLDEAMGRADERSLPGLWKAKSMALDAWSLLTGFPRPGVRKQSRPSRSIPDLQPVVSAPEPVQARLQHDPNEPNG